ncbi:MAG: photosystem II S4 domain protein [Candidatus Syntrophonatronum acetioxidans]|uniref:Photosystem II S4 domain protein n=1 Tax=Candidatus Syntrophonatronum acetioxidans TaxID=1795816 RepID=A0A424Y9P0_9FIRM|nr:MAG: photosystem II S4 domain protein [Candidatus Syntrophonatronum acetioxidans]
MKRDNNLDPHEKRLADIIEDKVDKVRRKNSPEVTDFLDPFQQKLAESFLKSCDDLTYIIYGGYSGAERARIAIMPKFWIGKTVDLNITLLDIKGNTRFKDLNHRDFLGAILSLGLKREKIGDILVEEEGGKVAVDTLVSSFIISNLEEVSSVAVTVREVKPEEVVERKERTKELKGTVASLRLDAVASLGFGFSRSKIVRAIKADQVKVNWQRANDPSFQVEKGDTISLRGKGRIIIDNVLGKSRKGRIQVLIKKIL